MSTINPGIFKGYDIRGIYPAELNEDNIVPIVKAIYAFLHRGKAENESLTLVVGTDMRTSSPSLTKTAMETLIGLGAHVVDIGLVSTPTFYFAVFHYDYEAGIQITASHNPKEWNGIKIVKKGPNGLIKIGKPTGIEEIQKMALKGQSVNAIPGGAVTKKTGILEEEVENALKIVGNPQLDTFKIVADPGNAMGAQYIQALSEKIPMNLVKMNFELDGTFPAHQPDPLQTKTLADLQKRVVEEKADLGLAPDGDGDRLFFIDEKGNIVRPTAIASIVASELLKRRHGAQILVEIRYLFALQKIVAENGGMLKITKVGHANISETMNETGGIFASESSAHYYFKETGNAESQIPVILTVLKVLTEKKKPFSQVLKEYQRSSESGEFNFEAANAKEILDKAKEAYKDGALEDMDGVAITYPNWRFSMRTSNTEPLLRLNVESYDKETMEQKRDEIIAFIKSFGAKPH